MCSDVDIVLSQSLLGNAKISVACLTAVLKGSEQSAGEKGYVQYFLYYLAGNLIGRKLSGRIMVKHKGLTSDLGRRATTKSWPSEVEK